MFHMGWFLGTGFGVYGWDTEWAGNVTSDVGNPDLFVYMAQSLERAGFDYMMLEDSSVLPNIFRGTFESSVKDGGTIRFDPMPLVPYLATATKHIGLVADGLDQLLPAVPGRAPVDHAGPRHPRPGGDQPGHLFPAPGGPELRPRRAHRAR